MQSIPWLGYTQSWIQQKQPGGVWWNWYSSKCKASMAWLYTVLNPTKAAGGVWWNWYSSKCKSIHGLAIHSPESNKSSPVEFDGIGTVANAKHPWLGYTQSWIQQKQPVEFDGIGTVANAKHPWLGYTQSWIQQKQPGGVWWNWYSSKCKASMAWLYTVLNPTKAARWSLLEFGTVANAKHPWRGYTQSWIQQKQPGGVWWNWYSSKCKSIHGLAIHSPESNKSSRWSLMELVTAANAKHPWLGYTQSWIQQKQPGGVWWNWYSSKCKASMAWLYTVLNPTKAAGGVWWNWYSSKCKASMAWLYTVLNPTKAARWSLMESVQ